MTHPAHPLTWPLLAPYAILDYTILYHYTSRSDAKGIPTASNMAAVFDALGVSIGCPFAPH